MHGTSRVRLPSDFSTSTASPSPTWLVPDDPRGPLPVGVGDEGGVHGRHGDEPLDHGVADQMGEADLAAGRPEQLVVDDGAVDLEQLGRHHPHAGGGGDAQRRLHVGHDAAGGTPQRASPSPASGPPDASGLASAPVTGPGAVGAAGGVGAGGAATDGGRRGSRGRRRRRPPVTNRPAGSRRRTPATTRTPRWDRPGTGRTCPRPARRWVRTRRCRVHRRRCAARRRALTCLLVPLRVRWPPSPSSLPGCPEDGRREPAAVTAALASSRGRSADQRDMQLQVRGCAHAGLASGEVPEPARPLLPSRRHRGRPARRQRGGDRLRPVARDRRPRGGRRLGPPGPQPGPRQPHRQSCWPTGRGSSSPTPG